MALHADELTVSDALVRRLVATQLPGLAGLHVEALRVSGSSNALFRLGQSLLVRLPRRPGGSETILKEARWLPQLAGSLPVPVPEVVAVGEPAYGYPEVWSVVRWLPGERPSSAAPPGGVALAHDLAAVVCALRAAEPAPEALVDPGLRWYRGERLSCMDADFRQYVEECRAIPELELDLDLVLAVWEDALAADRSVPATWPHWLHGDLLAENLLVRNGRLAAVLDFGGLAVGDPSVDLAVAWELLDPDARRAFRDAVGADGRRWMVGQGWALALAVMSFPYYWRSMPSRCADRLAMARRVLTDEG